MVRRYASVRSRRQMATRSCTFTNVCRTRRRVCAFSPAIRTYRRALQIAPDLAGAHYGLAFLLLKRGDTAHAGMHLEAFLAHSTDSAEDARFRAHAQQTLDRLKGVPMSEGPDDGPPDDSDGPDDGAAHNGGAG